MAVYIFLVTAILVLLYQLYNEIRSKISYWERKGIKGPKPQIPYGTFKPVFDKIAAPHTITEQIYKQYPNEKVVGIYQGLIPVLIIRDPTLVQRILIKDFGSFTDRGFRVTSEPRSMSMFSQDGAKWRIIRKKLTPMFTTGKLKNMMPIMNGCISDYMKYLDMLVAKQACWEILALNTKYTLKVVTSIVYGLDIEIFNDEEGVFNQMAQKKFQPSIWTTTACFLHSICPGLPDKLGMTTLTPEINSFFLNIVNQVMKQREGQPKLRKDFMDLLMELKEQGTVTEEDSAELEITDEVLLSQALLFFAAGTSTPSGAMSYLLYEFALNQSIQDRCFEEVKQIMEKYDRKLTYESLKEFPYTSMAFDEILRKYPLDGILFRQTVNDYTFPELNLTLKKGTKVFIPVSSFHMDEQYFPEPELFQPERFAPENKGLIRDCTYLPFGEGPRNCIALRFAKLQSMLGIVHFLYRYRVKPCEKTVTKIRPNPQSDKITSQEGLWLTIERR